MKKLNIGCGLCVGEDWINIDGSWNAWFANHRNLARLLTPAIGVGWKKWPQGIVKLHIKAKLPFKPKSIDAIYCSHFLEHLPRQECEELLYKCYHMLKDGGIFRAVVPDLEAMTRKYLKEIDSPSSTPAADKYFKALGVSRQAGRKGLAYYTYKLYQCVFDYHTHSWMYDIQSLSALLMETGFFSIEKRNAWESNIPDMEQVERKGAISPDGTGFCLECVKPGKVYR